MFKLFTGIVVAIAFSKMFKMVFVAAGADAANAFITPEMLASLSAAGLLPSLGVPCDPNLTDSMFRMNFANLERIHSK